MLRKFEVTAVRTDTYVIEIEDSVFDEEWKKDFERYFHPIGDVEDIARDLAFHQLRFGGEGTYRFVEGYGPVTRNGQLPFSTTDFFEGKLLPADKRDQPAPGVNIIIKSEDDDYDFEIKEIEA